MTTVLVTGGAGFIGSCFVRQQLATAIEKVVVLDRLTYAASLENLSEVQTDSRLVFIQGDIGDIPLLSEILRQHQIGRVIHFAAETHVDRSIDDPWPFIQTNVVGTCRLLEAVRQYWRDLPERLRRHFRFVHVSTDEVFGSLQGTDGAFTEDSPYRPNSPYAASKAAADYFVRSYHQTYGLPTMITHCTNNFGPYQFPEKLIPLTILNAVAGRPLPVYGHGHQRRDWLYVEEHCRGLAMVAERGVPGERYLFASGRDRSNLEVVETICAVVDRLCPHLPHRPTRSLITFVPDRPGHDFRYALDTRRTEQLLGWKPTNAFEQQLEATVRWYLEHPGWVSATRQRYDQRRLGLG